MAARRCSRGAVCIARCLVVAACLGAPLQPPETAVIAQPAKQTAPAWALDAAAPVLAVPPGLQSAPADACQAQANDSTVFAGATAGALRDAIAVAAPGSVVRIAGTCAGVDVTERALLVITKPLTLQGGFSAGNWITPSAANVTTLDAGLMGRVISVGVGAPLAVLGLTLTNGIARSRWMTDTMPRDQDGAGIHAASALTLTAVTVRNNSAGTHGGGVFAGDAGVVISVSHFVGNRAGDGWWDWEGAGGALLSRGPATIAGSHFEENSAFDSGAIALWSSLPSRVSDTRIVSNTADDRGGGIGAIGGALLLEHVHIASNKCTSFCWAGGGGVWATGSVWITRSVFMRNGSDHGGGAVSTLPYFDERPRNMRIVNSLFADNRGPRGAAIKLTSLITTEIVHATFAGAAIQEGAAIWVFDTRVWLTNTLFASHTIGVESMTGTISIGGSLFSGVAAPYSGTHIVDGGNFGGCACFFDHDHYKIAFHSDAIDRGLATVVAVDMEDQPRPFGAAPDVGWDELSMRRRVALPWTAR